MGKQEKGTFSRLFEIASKGRFNMVISCVSMGLGTLAGMFPYISVYFISRQLLIFGTDNESTKSVIVLWAILAAVSIVMHSALSFAGSLCAHKVAFRILYNIRVEVMEHIGRLSMGFFSDHTTGSIQKTMDDSIEKIEVFVAHILPDLIGSACVVVALLIGIGSLNLWLTLALVLAIIGGCALQLYVWGGNRGQEIFTGCAKVSGQMTGAFSEYVKGIAEVKLFGLTGTVTRSLNETTKKYSKWEMKLYKRSAPFYEGYKTIILSLLAVVLPVSTLLIWLHPNDNNILLASIMGLIVTPAICAPFLELVNYGLRMGELNIALQHIDDIMHIDPIKTNRQTIEPTSYDIAFHNVSFSYQDTSDPLHTLALKEVHFIAPQNQMTALVGPSGGGKTTIGQLISRFWDVTSGKITIGGVDIRAMSSTFLMDKVSFVFQDTYIFSDTVLGNITMNSDISKDKVEAAAKAAQCHDFIMALPKGYETLIGSGGIGLSGGEAQRIAIARTILKDSPIVILDEALAYSDAENENQIQEAINNLIINKTVIVIAHRLPSIKNAEQILVIDKGEIKERGTHEKLIASDTLYHDLWIIQNEVDAWSIERQNVNHGKEG